MRPPDTQVALAVNLSHADVLLGLDWQPAFLGSPCFVFSSINFMILILHFSTMSIFAIMFLYF